MNVDVHVSFHIRVSSGCVPRSGVAESDGGCNLQFFKEPPYCSPECLHQFAFPSTV